MNVSSEVRSGGLRGGRAPLGPGPNFQLLFLQYSIHSLKAVFFLLRELSEKIFATISKIEYIIIFLSENLIYMKIQGYELNWDK